VGTHSFRHPFTFNKMSEVKAGEEIEKGIDAVASALGGRDEVAPFFRVPGFLTSKNTEAAAAKRISGAEVAKRAKLKVDAVSISIASVLLFGQPPVKILALKAREASFEQCAIALDIVAMRSQAS
jgi:hypothetical protein